MASLLSRNANYVCRTCRSRQTSVIALQHLTTRAETSTSSYQPTRIQTRPASSSIPSVKSSRIPSSRQSPHTSSPKREPPRTPRPAPTPIKTTPEVPIDPEDVRGTLRGIQHEVNAVCASQTPPQEARVLEIMDRAHQFANLLVFGQTTAPDEETLNHEDQSSLDTPLISELDEPSQLPKAASTSSSSPTSHPTPTSLPISSRERSAQTLSETIYTLIKDPEIHISEPILSAYVRIICQLGNPEYLPEIFFLYAHKPQAIPNTSPVQYRNPSPSAPKNAIPQSLSDVALDTAILQKDLSLAVAIIDTTVSTRAFRLNKFIRKASLPLGLVGTTPIAAYAAADWVANWQNSLDPAMAKAVTLMASAAYLGTLSTIGFVAVTTWNDHHERVRWSEGTPLRYRWTREEERLYFDRIAMAWGFQRKRRRGEEMGELWEELREECGSRGLVLDKSELLPGMQ